MAKLVKAQAVNVDTEVYVVIDGKIKYVTDTVERESARACGPERPDDKTVRPEAKGDRNGG